jgi:predicted PurR-regulated permease PerM
MPDRGRGPGFGIDPVAARVTWTILLIAAALGLIYLLGQLLVLLAFSVFFAYLIYPFVKLVQRWVPGFRSWTRAIVAVYILLLGGLAIAAAAAGPRVATEVRGFAERLPQIAQQVSTGSIVTGTLQRYGWSPEAIVRIENAVRGYARGVLASAQGAAVAVVKWLTGAWGIILVPIFAFFLLKDGPAAMEAATQQLEQRKYRERVRSIAQDLHHLLGEYMRALVLLSLVTFIVWWIVLGVVGAPYPIILAALGGVLEVIPLVGPVVAGVILLTVTGFAGYGHALGLLAFVIAWRFIQDYVTSPAIMGRGIEVHPALVIFGVIAGGEIAGPVGMFFSVPVIAALRIVWRHAVPDRTRTDYAGGHE